METEVNENEVVEVANDTTDYKALYEQSTGKVNELEGLIQKHKDKKTTKVDTPSYFWKEDVQKMLTEERFYLDNPTMAEHKEAIEKFTSNGLSHADAMTLVMSNDSTIQARKDTSNSNFTSWSAWVGEKTYSQEDLYKMPHAQKMQALRDINAGKAKQTA